MAEDREDFLDEDPEISGQKFVLLSFISPEKVLARKDLFFFEQFLKDYEVQWKTKNLEKFLADQVLAFNNKLDAEANKLLEKGLGDQAEICRASRVAIDVTIAAYQEFVKQNQKDITSTTIKEAYDDFFYKNSKKLEDEFYAKNNFHTTVRGLKVRGVYGQQEEAVARSKKLQRNDKVHNIFVGEVGKWLPWDPEPKDIKEQEYAEEQLNQLMKGYKENEEAREKFFSDNPQAKKRAQDSRGVKNVVTDKAVASSGVTIERVASDDASATASMFAPATSSEQNAALFGGPADLALERKLKRDEEKKD